MNKTESEKIPSEYETLVESSLNTLVDLDNPVGNRIEASEVLRKNLPKIFNENVELFEECCEEVIEIFPEEQEPNIRENVFCALGDSMDPEVESVCPEIWERSMDLFSFYNEKGSLGKKANHYLLCMTFGQNPIEVQKSIVRRKKYKSILKRIRRLERYESSGKKLLTNKLHKYIYPELLDEQEVFFALGFNAVCSRLSHEYNRLTREIKSNPSGNEELEAENDEIVNGIITLIEVLDNCMTFELEERRPDLYQEGMNKIRKLSSYSMTLTLGQKPGEKIIVPDSFERVTKKAIEVGLKKGLKKIK